MHRPLANRKGRHEKEKENYFRKKEEIRLLRVQREKGGKKKRVAQREKKKTPFLYRSTVKGKGGKEHYCFTGYKKERRTAAQPLCGYLTGASGEKEENATSC